MFKWIKRIIDDFRVRIFFSKVLSERIDLLERNVRQLKQIIIDMYKSVKLTCDDGLVEYGLLENLDDIIKGAIQ